MSWDKNNPSGATKIKDSDDEIRDNMAAIETVLGTNITAGPTTIQGAIQGDTTKGRIFRELQIVISNGTTSVSLKCTVINIWNGDEIAETDDIVKATTTGNFTVDANGTQIKIEAAGLTGNCVCAFGFIGINASNVDLTLFCDATSNDIRIKLPNSVTGVMQDLTTLVDTGDINIFIMYITDA